MDDTSSLVVFAIVAGIGVLVFRELVTWYWKLNEIVSLLRGIDQKLERILSSPRAEPPGQHQHGQLEPQDTPARGADSYERRCKEPSTSNQRVAGSRSGLGIVSSMQRTEKHARTTRSGRSVAAPLTLIGFAGLGVVVVAMVTTMYGRREAPVTIYARHPETTLLLSFVRMADDNGDWVANLVHGQEVTLLRSDGTNCQIRTEYGQVGWLSCDFLDEVPFVNSPKRWEGPVVSYATRAPAPTRQSSPAPTVIVSLLSRVKTANGYDWWRANDADKIALCKWFAQQVGSAYGSSVSWEYFYSGLTEFYTSGERVVLERKIDEVAGALLLVYE